MLHVTDIGDRITVRCSCQCFAVSLRSPKALRDGIVRCLFCTSRATLSDLLRDWETEHADAPIH